MAESSIQIHDYMGSQNQINENMRMILVDWLTEVHHVYKLSPETLYLTIQIIDRYLSTRLVHMKELQLLGISSVLLASKYVDIWAPMVNDLVCISERSYSKEHILGMEKSILAKLGWSLSGPTPYVFLVRFVKAAMADKEMENMAFFLTELGLLHYGMLKFCPSMLAASAVYAARCTLNKTPHWDEMLNFHTGYSEPQLIECAKQLVSFHSRTCQCQSLVQNPVGAIGGLLIDIPSENVSINCPARQAGSSTNVSTNTLTTFLSRGAARKLYQVKKFT
ncbi:hypothetical protein C5167_034251 [Papaver somniferum]|uniref:Uncharacterized protein n=1 Tax=Papaver somniferum TaxID=3469 RepID=A0A4Y7KFG3_PAPSO|nr:hypothetical protein C5167_034251 [Papaver somniferum]